ncbi:MAG: hypothetical protein WC718_14825 [Phycisphaerales bacterium]|jgi:hypothetical protein
MMGGFRIIESAQAKVFWGAGAANAAGAVATTLDGAVVAGATRVILTSAASVSAGQYITIGTVETEAVAPSSTLEQVYVVTVDPDGDNANELEIQGVGDGTNLGLRYDHASAEVVTTDYNVCGVPVLGKNSLLGAYGSSTGKFGQPKFKEGLDILDRQFYAGWYWYGGVTRVERNILLGKVATSGWTIGSD